MFGLNEGIDDSGETPYSAVLRRTAGVPAPSVWWVVYERWEEPVLLC